MLPPLSHRNLLLHEAAAAIMTRTEANGGATFRLESDGRLERGAGPQSGWAIGQRGGWAGQATYNALLEALYGFQARDMLPGTFGTWLEDGRLYVDPVIIVVTARSEALEIARDNGQRAIYNLATGETVYTEGDES